MDRIGVAGTSYRTADMKSLAQAALPADFPRESLQELARLSGFAELVYLGTCNRVEFYYRTEGPHHSRNLLFHLRRSLADLTNGSCQLPEDNDAVYVHRGQAAARHLFRVTSALDSMMVGEAQIAGQAKDAHERAHEADLLGGFLDQVFHEAFHLAKRIRTETELTRRPVSLVTLVERKLHEHLSASSSPVLILGAGEMASQTYRLVRGGDRDRKLLIANRNPNRAEEMVAGDANAGFLSLDSVLLEPPRVGLVVAATSSEDILLENQQVAAIRNSIPADEPVLLVDLALPPNIDPSCDQNEGVELHGIEAMRAQAEKNRTLRMAEIDRCETLVEHQLLILRRRMLDRALSPVARSLHESFRDVAERTVQHALSKRLAHLGDGDREAVEGMAADLVKRLVQVPLRGLKGAAWSHSDAVLDGFLRGLDDSDGGGPQNGGRG
ncbi:MAG: glutamyl-tRNA reductase [bacterium]|nr:glutamyl-tRNA reductase [bacterium]